MHCNILACKYFAAKCVRYPYWLSCFNLGCKFYLGSAEKLWHVQYVRISGTSLELTWTWSLQSASIFNIFFGQIINYNLLTKLYWSNVYQVLHNFIPINIIFAISFSHPTIHKHCPLSHFHSPFTEGHYKIQKFCWDESH